MQVGGEADYFAEPAKEEGLAELVEFARQESLPFVILGKGSNSIFPDEGYPGLVISLLHYEQDQIFFDRERCLVKASSGIFLYRLVLMARDHGLAGIEFLANVPGTVGGALIMNAGFCRFPGQTNEIGDLVEKVEVMNENGTKQILRKEDLKFSYRSSNLTGHIVLAATLKLWRRSREAIEAEVQANFQYRNAKQDLRYPSSGSIFKNPASPFSSAGRLIEQAGLKGARVGAAMVSTKHGNYIVNVGGAKSSDIIQLIREVQEKVFHDSGVLLEPEVRIIQTT
jgi:UDP-N-acetylmuramate dehydrogenase